MRSTKKTGILILSLTLLAGLAGTMACQKKAAETPAAEQMKVVSEFEGTVRAALGRYMYLSTAMGFDIVLPGFDAATLMGKTIKVKGNLLREHPPIFLADTVESGGQTVYTRSQEFQAEDFIEMKVREAVPALAITGVAKPEEWEGKGQAKVYGKLQKGDVNRIVLTDDKGPRDRQDHRRFRQPLRELLHPEAAAVRHVLVLSQRQGFRRQARPHPDQGDLPRRRRRRRPLLIGRSF